MHCARSAASVHIVTIEFNSAVAPGVNGFFIADSESHRKRVASSANIRANTPSRPYLGKAATYLLTSCAGSDSSQNSWTTIGACEARSLAKFTRVSASGIDSVA